MPPRQSAVSRLFEFFHTHEHGRLYEFLFFTAIGIVIAIAAWAWYRSGGLAEPIFWLLMLVAVCFVLFAALPQKKRAAPPEPELKGKRGEIAKQVKASKAEKRKGPPPPIH